MPRRRPRPVENTELTQPQVTNFDAEEVVEAEKDDTQPEPVKETKPRTSRKVDTPDVGVVETKEEPRPVKPNMMANRAPQKPYQEGVPNGIIIEPGQDVYLEGDDDGITVTVSRDVYSKVQPRGARRPSYILLYPRGTKVVKSMLQKKAKG